jgi:hypothetical protein
MKLTIPSHVTELWLVINFRADFSDEIYVRSANLSKIIVPYTYTQSHIHHVKLRYFKPLKKKYIQIPKKYTYITGKIQHLNHVMIISLFNAKNVIVNDTFKKNVETKIKNMYFNTNPNPFETRIIIHI